MFNGAFGLPGDIDFAFFQALTQIVRWQIDQHHLVGSVKRIRYGFAYLNSRHAADHVVQAFKMLHVDGGKDINTGVEQFFNVLPALGMA